MESFWGKAVILQYSVNILRGNAKALRYNLCNFTNLIFSPSHCLKRDFVKTFQ